MLLAELLAASERVAATRSRLVKIDTLAQCLRRLDASEISLGVAYLSGDTPQGKVGIGYATLKDALAAKPAGAHQLALVQIDEALTRLAQIKGKAPPPSERACSRSFSHARPCPSRTFSRGCCSESCARARSKGSCSTPSQRRRTCGPSGRSEER